MKTFSKMWEIDINNINIKGWMYDYLKLQEKGLTGNLDKCGYPFDSYGWYEFDLTNYEDEEASTDMLERKGKECPHWWPYEQTAYLLDGMERCGQLLNSKELLDKAEKSFVFSLSNQDKDGFIGPRFLKTNNRWNKWPGVVFFRALLAHYSATKDEKIIKSIERYYLDSNIDFSNGRDVFNVEIMLLTYLISKNQELLKLAVSTYEKYNESATSDSCDKVALSTKIPYEHGVTYNEYSKLGALLYICTGEEKYLKASISAYRKIDKYFMLASGLHCSNEYLRSNNYMQSHEACDISDYTWALGYLLMATGDSMYADKIEKCILNAGIGSVIEDFKALQYFSCPNQLIVDETSNHNSYYRGKNWMAYRPNHTTQCCPGNVTRFFPNYCMKMWMKGENSLYSIFFGECDFSANVNNNQICISEKTNYPFDDCIHYDIKSCDIPFDLCVRIPKWCTEPKITVNNIAVKITKKKGFAQIKGVKKGDKITVCIPSEIKISKYNNNGVVIQKGPLVYSYGMYGERKFDTEGKFPEGFPVYALYPDKEWNYALASTDSKDFKFLYRKIEGDPWDIRNTPHIIYAPAKKVDGWELSEKNEVIESVEKGSKPPLLRKVQRKCVLTPKLPTKKQICASKNNETEIIELVPLAVAKLRLTIFPIIE